MDYNSLFTNTSGLHFRILLLLFYNRTAYVISIHTFMCALHAITLRFLPCYVSVPKALVIVASICSKNSTNNAVWYVCMMFNDAMKYLDYIVLIQ